MKQKRWYQVPRRDGAKVQRGQHLTRPLIERVREATRAKAADVLKQRAAAKTKWFEHPRRKQ